MVKRASVRRVVVTGLGVVSPLGIGVSAFWDSCVSGRSGIGPVTAFQANGLTSRIAGEVKGFDPLNYMSDKKSGRTERFMQLVLAAAREAAEHSGALRNVEPERLGVMLGNGGGGLGALDGFMALARENGWESAPRLALLKLLPDMATCNLAIEVGAKGPIMTIVASCVSSTLAIGHALQLIRSGTVDAVLACGTEAGITRVGMAGFCLLGALSARNEEPERASRPFDRERDGFVLAEGAGALVLEEYSHARSRGAPILAEVLGYAQTSDGYHLVMPDREGDGAMRCMRKAMADAGVGPQDVDYINAHGTSTRLNDIAETRAVKAVFGRRSHDVPLSSVKSMMGHTLGAAGAIEGVAAVMSLKTGILPPTVNLDSPDRECDLDYVALRARSKTVNVLLKNSFGFGGQNASFVLAK